MSVYLYCYWYKCFWVNSVQSATEKWINQKKMLSKGALSTGVKFMPEILQYPPEWLVFLDETGSDRKDHIHKFGYSLIGEPPVYHRFLGRGTRILVIAALSTDGSVMN